MVHESTVVRARNILRKPGNTSDRILAIASKGTRAPRSLKPEEIQAVCASALAQAPSPKGDDDDGSAARLYRPDTR